MKILVKTQDPNERLKLAAQAAGIMIKWDLRLGGYVESGASMVWNPRENLDQALRLASLLGIELELHDNDEVPEDGLCIAVMPNKPKGLSGLTPLGPMQYYQDDPEGAQCRAIMHAAVLEAEKRLGI
ncbi:hypothetical protein HMPREF1487_09442 [Pseudomonas sp. HPB0071]|nr:hypothetical protein HMPREF1487_09442 [Pseudomonas sp. HPB0071]